MSLSRRDFLRYGMAAASSAAASGTIDLSPVEAAATSLRIKEAKAFPGVCPYCAVGCAQLIYVKDGKIVDIEGDPDAPHTEGALCPKGSSTYQLSLNERRITGCLYRAPGATAWEEKPLDWMMAEIAQRVKKSRDATFVETVKVGANEVPVNRCEGIAWLGSSVLDNEENYLIAKLARGLGLVNLENSARLCHSATVPALGTTFGRGAMTTNLIDLQHSDVIMITSNMAENHPVGFQWVMKAKERGAKVIHVDPRYTRTSAAADIHMPLRSGTNIAFFGGLMNYAMQKNLYFKEYVVHYTNASFLLDPAFKNATDLNGLFTGYDGSKKSYDRSSWKYQLDGEGNPRRDLTLRDPLTVFQHLRRQYSRYTPAMVERVCGIPKAKFEEVAKLYCGTSGPDKTGTITYALNLTQHTNGVENIRSLCMLQLLLGNIGRPGGGVTALRGHANVQGATDLELLYHELPGYLAMPLRDAHPDLKTYLEKETPKGGFWVNKPKFMVSLLKAFYGDAATKDNEFGYQWIAKRASADAYSHQHMFVDMYNGIIKGFLAANFTYGSKPDHPEMVEVLKEINGVATEEITDKDGKVVYRKGQPIASFAQLTDDGKTTSGCWIYTGVTVESPDGKLINKAASRKPAEGNDYLAHGWGFAWPANRRILYNRASADLAGKPWSEKKKLIWWDPAAPGQKPEDKPGKWVGLDVPDFNACLAPDTKNGDTPLISAPDLMGRFYGPRNL